MQTSNVSRGYSCRQREVYSTHVGATAMAGEHRLIPSQSTRVRIARSSRGALLDLGAKLGQGLPPPGDEQRR